MTTVEMETAQAITLGKFACTDLRGIEVNQRLIHRPLAEKCPELRGAQARFERAFREYQTKVRYHFGATDMGGL